MAFTESTKPDDGLPGRRTKAVLMQQPDPDNQPQNKHVRYYDPKSKTVALEENNGQKMRLVLSETHFWAHDKDWMWDKMDRHDRDGNLVICCQVIRRKSNE